MLISVGASVENSLPKYSPYVGKKQGQVWKIAFRRKELHLVYIYTVFTIISFSHYLSYW